MINFFFNGNPTEQKQKELKEWFIKELGDFKKEFEDNDGVVTFNCNLPEDDPNYTEYVIPEKNLNRDFLGRFQLYHSKQRKRHQ